MQVRTTSVFPTSQINFNRSRYRPHDPDQLALARRLPASHAGSLRNATGAHSRRRSRPRTSAGNARRRLPRGGWLPTVHRHTRDGFLNWHSSNGTALPCLTGTLQNARQRTRPGVCPKRLSRPGRRGPHPHVPRQRLIHRHGYPPSTQSASPPTARSGLPCRLQAITARQGR